MKHFSILILSLFVSSCFGTQKTIENQSEANKEFTVNAEVLDTTKVETNEAKLYELIEVIDNNGNTIAEVESHDEAIKLLETKTQNNSIQFKDLAKFTFSHDNWNILLQKHVSINGNVNYIGFKNDRQKLNTYIKSLTKATIDKWSKEEQLAYWINAYNALTIDLILRNYPLNSIKDIKNPWDQRLWKFGEKWFNLNDIEHKILRKMNEPRIHFAIVCASISCPKLQNTAFTASKIDEQLTNATKEFLEDKTKNEISKHNIKLSKIFKWFKKDFEHNATLIDFLNQNSKIIITNNAKKSYKDYNWNLNE